MKKLALLLVFALLFTSALCSCSPKKPVFDNKAATDAYREFVKELPYDSENSSARYNIVDIDGDGAVELLVYNEARLSAYTYKANEEEAVQKLGEEIGYRIYNNTYRAQDVKKYPGLFVRTHEYAYVGDNIYSYVTIKDGQLVEEKIWNEQASAYGGETQNVITYHQDKEFVKDAKKVFEEKNILRWYAPGFMTSVRNYIPADYSKDEEYNYKIMLFNQTIAKDVLTDAYAIYDVNGDGNVDLLTYSQDTFAIYSLANDVVKRMYVSTCDKKIGTVSVLKNGDVLTEYNNGIQNYIYDDLGSEFETVSTISFGYSEIGDETEYTFAAETVNKTEWDKKAEKYLKAEKVKIQWLPEAYEEYEKYIDDDSKAGRDIGPFHVDTQEIIKIENKYYQSYVNEKDVRYILVSYDEYKVTLGWQWVPVGTKDKYSLDSLGEIKKS